MIVVGSARQSRGWLGRWERLSERVIWSVAGAVTTVVMSAGEAVSRGTGSGSGKALRVLVAACPGEVFDGPVEPVPGRAPDHGAFEGPVG